MLGLQRLRLSPQLGGSLGAPSATAVPSSVQRQADYIVAIVNSEPVTNNEVRIRMLRAEQQLSQFKTMSLGVLQVFSIVFGIVATALLLLWCAARRVPLFARDGTLRSGLLAGLLFAAMVIVTAAFVGLHQLHTRVRASTSLRTAAVLVFQAIPLMLVLFLFLIYLLHTTGELCLSPVGLSAMSRLTPLHLGSFIMGAWFYMTAVGNFVAGKIGEATGGEGGEMSKELTLAIYSQIGWITIGVSVVVLAVSPIVKKWMHLDTLEDRAEPKGE